MDWNVWVGLGLILISILWALNRTLFVSYREPVKFKRQKPKPLWFQILVKYKTEIVILLGGLLSIFGDILKKLLEKWLGL